MSIKSLNKELLKLEAELNVFMTQRKERLNAIYKRFKDCYFQCASCKKSSKLKEVTCFIATSYDDWDVPYDPEHSLVCPKCLVRNRILSDKARKEHVNPAYKCYKDVVFHTVLSSYNDKMLYDIGGKPVSFNELEWINK